MSCSGSYLGECDIGECGIEEYGIDRQGIKGDDMGVNTEDFYVYGTKVPSRLWLGSSGYANLQLLENSVKCAKPGFVTLSLRRQLADFKQKIPEHQQNKTFWQTLKGLDVPLLPNTAGCFSAQEAINLALLSREALETDWIKVEVIGDENSLHPDMLATLKACEFLLKAGFKVLPYCTDDLVLCHKLVDLGCQVLMPLGAPIGTGMGLLSPFTLERLRNKFPDITLVLDAGIGKPSEATAVLEMGFDAVLLNTAVSQAKHPVTMAQAFKYAVLSGRAGFLGVTMQVQPNAVASTAALDCDLSAAIGVPPEWNREWT